MPNLQTLPLLAPIGLPFPSGNGYPVSAVAVSKELASAFSSGGMEYFNTYGGATAACAAALATLRVVHEERYQEHAVQVRFGVREW